MIAHQPPIASSHTPPPNDPIRVLIAHPYPVVRTGVISLVTQQIDMQVVGEAFDEADTLRLTVELNPDLLVLGISLPSFSGVRVMARFHEIRPDQKVLVLTRYEDCGTMRSLLSLGARGYVHKSARPEELLRALRAVAAGGTFIDTRMAKHVVPYATDQVADPELSERERVVLQRLALGNSNKEIAARLALSVKTVETYKTRAMKKLNLHGRVDLVRYATGQGWLTDDEG